MGIAAVRDVRPCDTFGVGSRFWIAPGSGSVLCVRPRVPYLMFPPVTFPTVGVGKSCQNDNSGSAVGGSHVGSR